ncbi:MAG TPA: amino acid adenylation domain-containing protein, partial [Candidatus Deferrimicrobium sp.]|nr:amino acid adenylation domain-containing protein [Candidatus Deferrimicrobium sp.]
MSPQGGGDTLDIRITEKISEWALCQPGKIAIKSEDRSVSYRELENRSNRIAHFMHGKIVAIPHIIIILDRSASLIEAILGLLKCGLVFVPVDPLLPANRIKTMIRESRAEWVITDNNYYEKFKDILDNHEDGIAAPGLKILLIDAHDQGDGDGHRENRFYLEPFTGNESVGLTFESVFNKHCYIYFTSGSTGTPKGILGRREGLAHFIRWEMNEFGVDEHFNVSQMTPPSFDVFLRDIFLPLMAGGTCCIPSRHTLLDMKRLIRWIDDNEITLIHTVPSLFKQLVSEIEDPHCFKSLQYILLAGELLRGGDIHHFTRLFKQRIGLVNIYGPTETTLAKLFYRIQPGDEDRSVIPVGKPIDGAQVLILNSLKQKCQQGDYGEIYIRTPFRSAGYYNQPERTESVFIKNPYGRHPDDLLYKTGDLGRRLPDGNIEISGRIDFQVKIRGVRIETGEIENRLLNYPGIRDVLVLARDDQSGEKTLCAYIVTSSGERVPVADLKKYLAAELPDVMIPAYFVQVESFPLTPSGKIDRRALPEPVIEVGENYVAPGDEIETKLLKIWSDVLRRDEDKISVLANFFELGGHSLKVAALAAKIHKEFNANIPLAQFFKINTIRELARYIRRIEKDQYLEIEPTEKKLYYPLTSAQKRLYFLQVMEETGTGYNMPQVMKLEGKINAAKLENTFRKLIQRHESFRTSFIMVEEEPVQRIHDEVESKSFAELFQKRPLGEPPGAIIESFIRPFDLSQAPLLRVGLLKLAKEEYLLMVDMHHIISDGVSMVVLVKEFMALYEGRELSPLRLQYKDYAWWQAHRRGETARQEAFWLSEFGEFEDIPELELPLDYERPRVQSFEGRSVGFDLGSGETRDLKALALKQGATLYMVLLAIYDIFLAKTGNRESVVVGTPVAGRLHADLEQVIGMFVNTLALKNVPAGEKSFNSFLEEVKEKTLSAFANQEYPYEELVEKVNIDRDTGRNPLFDTMFVLQNLDFPAIEILGLKLKSYPYERRTAKLDLTFVCSESDGRLFFTVEYAVWLFKQETALRLSEYFKKVVAAVLANPGVKISGIEILSAEEKEQLLLHFNSTAVDYPKDKTVHRLFEEQVAQAP